MRKLGIVCLICLLCGTVLSAAEWQWSVKVKGCVSRETGEPQEAFLWIPPACERVKAVMVGQQNMSEETLFHLSAFREAMGRLGVALIWITPELDQRWDVTTGVQEAFDKMLADLAEVSGYTELVDVPMELCRMESGADIGCHFLTWRCSAH